MDNSKIFENLKSILSQYELQLSILHNKADNYYLGFAQQPLNALYI
jgi:hypothetical protein